LILLVAGILYLPELIFLKTIAVPDPHKIPAWMIETVVGWFGDFRSASIEGRMLVAWPLVLLLAPRRLLGLVFLLVLGSGLLIQFWVLLSGEIRPASILVNPSALDLLSGGALAGAMSPGGGNSENGRLGRWAILMGLVLSLASISFWYQEGLPNWGTVAVLAAPPGFGAVNFILEIIGTTLVASLSWREVGELMEGLKH
jgi:peptidoglycan/LPS O-acetylase OafA/YrhL